MAIRMLTTKTRLRIEQIIKRLAIGDSVSLVERIELKKYSVHIPFIAGKIAQALRTRRSLGIE